RLYQNRQAINPPPAAIPAPWANFSLFQYSQFTPQSLQAHGFADFKIDWNVTRGGDFFLRWLCGLGHTAPHLVGHQNCVAYTEPDGRLHLLEYVSGSWVDQDIAHDVPSANIVGTLPNAGGDPAAAAVGNEEVIVSRAAAGSVHALTRDITGTDASWHATDITGGGGAAFDDPFVTVFQNNIHVVYQDEFAELVHVTRVNGVWRTESFADRSGAAGQSRICGSPAAYGYQNALHVVARSRDAGHLFDFTAPAGSAPQDLTAASHAANGQTPAATYRPTTYARAGEAPRIVFRALRGHIWQIARDTLNATDLSAAATAPTAAGSPSAVAADTARIVYRATAATIHEICDDRGTWRTRSVCADAPAVSDPTAYVDETGNAAATFRLMNGAIRVARLINGVWTCEDA